MQTTHRAIFVLVSALLLSLALLTCSSEREIVDTTRPAAVTDLDIDSIRGSAIFFSWTATGDDGNQGQASFYDLRFAHNSATLQSWGGAMQVLGEPIPGPSGTHEEMMLNMTSSDSVSYFGVKVSDESRNTSPLSNIVSH